MKLDQITRIDKLTNEQRAAMPGWRDKWIRIGLSTEPADRPKFEAGARGCYRSANLAEPERIVWVESPYVLGLACVTLGLLRRRSAVLSSVGGAVGDAVGDAVSGAMLSSVSSAVRSAVGGAVRSAVGGAVRSAVGDAVIGAVGDAVGGAVRSAVLSSVSSAVRNAVGDAVLSSVGDAVRDAVGGAVGGAVRSAVGDFDLQYLGGQFGVGGWYGGPAFWSFFTDVCRLAIPQKIMSAAEASRSICESACWWVPYKEVVLASERPTKILRDEQGRLHSEIGNAIEWPDGWGFASWHGTTIPLEWLTNRSDLNPHTALTWPNIEQRRAATEIIGWAKVLSSLPHTVIDADPDPQIGALISVDLPYAPGSRFVLVRCATGRDFALAVPPTVTTALEANAWTYGVDGDLLKQLEART